MDAWRWGGTWTAVVKLEMGANSLVQGRLSFLEAGGKRRSFFLGRVSGLANRVFCGLTECGREELEAVSRREFGATGTICRESFEKVLKAVEVHADLRILPPSLIRRGEMGAPELPKVTTRWGHATRSGTARFSDEILAFKIPAVDCPQ